MKRFDAIAIGGALVVLVLLGSCPSPFKEQDLTAGFDDQPPEIILTHPADGDSYGSALLVSGTVHDTASGSSGEVASLHCAVASLMAETEITIGDDGTFQYLVNCGSFSGSIVLEVTARDWNGNERVVSVNLIDTESDVAAFSATPGNGVVQLSWDTVAGATGLTLYEYISGYSIDIDPDETTFEYVGTSDQPLHNGDQVLFQLRAEMEGDYRDSWSDTVTCVPLSPFTLLPATKSGDGVVEVHWRDVPACERYAVLRSTSRDPETFEVHRIVSGSSLTDSDVVAGVTYFYRVHPDGEETILSEVVAGAPHSLRNPAASHANTIASPTYGIEYVVRVDDYLYAFDRRGVGDGNDLLRTYSLADPQTPVEVHTYTDSASTQPVTWPWNSSVAVSGEYLYAATQPDRDDQSVPDNNADRGIAVLDISNGSSVELTKHYVWDPDRKVEHVEVAGNYLYFTDNNQATHFYVETLSSLNAGVDIGSLTDATVADNDSGADYDFAGTVDWDTPAALGAYGTEYLYLSDSSKGFFAVPLVTGTGQPDDGSPAVNPFNIHTAAWASSPGGSANDYDVEHIVAGPGVLAVAARRDITGDDDTGVVTLLDLVDDDDTDDDAATLVNPVVQATIEFDADVGRPSFDGERLIVPADNEHVTHIYDVSDLKYPVLRQSISTPSANPMTVAVSDDYYYVAGRWAGILVLGNGDTLATTATDATPSLSGSPDILDVKIDGDRAYMIDSNGVFHVLDASLDPENPQVLGSLDLAIPAEQAYYNDSVVVIGSVVGVSSKRGFTLVDVSDTSNPRELATILEAARPVFALPHGDACFVFTALQGALVVDIADPQTPEVIATLPIPGTAEFPTMDDDVLYVPTIEGELVALDVADPFDVDVLDTVNIVNATGIDKPVVSAAYVNEYIYAAYCIEGDALAFAVIDANNPDSLVDVSNDHGEFIYFYESGDPGNPLDPDPGFVLPFFLMPISDDLLLSCGFVYIEEVGPVGNEFAGVHAISTSIPAQPSFELSVPETSLSALVYSGDWFGNWGYFADQLNGLMYLNWGQ